MKQKSITRNELLLTQDFSEPFRDQSFGSDVLLVVTEGDGECCTFGFYDDTKDSVGEFFSVALTSNKQEADTGTKMIHLAPGTRSRIVSKGISAGESRNTYRGLVKVGPKAFKTNNYSQCDSLLIGKKSSANTFPYIEAQNSYTQIEHEASTSRIAEEQLFYLLQRGIEAEEAVSLMVNGFCKEVFNELPLEFASEADRLLSLKLEGSVG